MLGQGPGLPAGGTLRVQARRPSARAALATERRAWRWPPSMLAAGVWAALRPGGRVTIESARRQKLDQRRERLFTDLAVGRAAAAGGLPRRGALRVAPRGTDAGARARIRRAGRGRGGLAPIVAAHGLHVADVRRKSRSTSAAAARSRRVAPLRGGADRRPARPQRRRQVDAAVDCVHAAGAVRRTGALRRPRPSRTARRCARASACSATTSTCIPSSPPRRTCVSSRGCTASRTSRRRVTAALERAGLDDPARRSGGGVLARHAPASRARARAAAPAAAGAARRAVHRPGRRRDGGPPATARRSCANRAASCWWRRTISETIEPIADRAVVLQNGRLVPIGPGPGSLRERYRVAAAASTADDGRQGRPDAKRS